MVIIPKINQILIFTIFISIIGIIDEPILLYMGLEYDGLEEIIFEVAFILVEVTLLFMAYFIGKTMILQSKEKKEHYRRLIDLSPEALFVRRKGKIVYANQASAALLGTDSVANLLNQDWEELLDFDSYNPKSLSRKNLKNRKEKVSNYQIRARRLDGQVIDLEITSTTVEFDGVTAREIIARDITIRKKQEMMIKELAFQDELTKLPNRRAFLYQLEQLLIDSQRSKTTFAVIMIDLDGFKMVNDSKGHKAGDELLKKVSVSLKDSIRHQDIVARLGGDEFTILLPRARQQDCVLIANRIIESLGKSDKGPIVTPSIGIALYPQNGKDAVSLLNHADKAMYQAKSKGKNTYQFA